VSPCAERNAKSSGKQGKFCDAFLKEKRKILLRERGKKIRVFGNIHAENKCKPNDKKQQQNNNVVQLCGGIENGGSFVEVVWFLEREKCF